MEPALRQRILSPNVQWMLNADEPEGEPPTQPRPTARPGAVEQPDRSLPAPAPAHAVAPGPPEERVGREQRPPPQRIVLGHSLPQQRMGAPAPPNHPPQPRAQAPHRPVAHRTIPACHVCHVCHKVFSQASWLRRHVRTHTGERPYPCSQCDRAFVQAGDLKRHVRTHTGERPHECDICGKAFTVAGNMVRHRLTHNRNRTKRSQPQPPAQAP